MKPRVFLFVFLAGVLWFGQGVNRAFADWQLTWNDEFDGNAVNTSNWGFDIGTGPPYPGWGNNELEYYTSRTNNVFVSGGLLHIVARAESYNGSSYTSAKLKTSGLFSQKYGRFEFYAKLPTGQGYWPALWMMPQDSVYGGWASSGEIDVMENRGSDRTRVLGTIHYGAAWPNNVYSQGPSFQFTGGDSVTNFHLYAMEWDTNAIRWYVDNQLYETQTSWWSSGGPYPAPFDQRFYIIMNLAVGGNFGGNPDGTTVFPGEMLVDYVRVYAWNGLVEPPPAPVMKLRMPFDDAGGGTTTPSDTHEGGLNVSMQMANGSGVAADYHGAANSGVATVGRSLNFSSGGGQPVMPGPLAAVTNASLGFGTVSNFAVSLWFKQNALMANGANIGPRMFVLGAGTPSDSGAANSIGLKFQTWSQLSFQLGGTTAMATFPTNLPANTWLFFAATYDGSVVRLFQGTETNAATLISTTAASGNINFGSSAALYAGNRQDRQRSFNGWIDDFRFYTGLADANFVEACRLLGGSVPGGLSAAAGDGGVDLSWSAANGATGYNVKRATSSGGPFVTLAAGTNVSGNAFTDLTVSNGTTYYYVVSSLNAAGESADSAQASATLNGPIVPPVLSATLLPGALQLSWPTQSSNWLLQNQTNPASTGLGTNWLNMPGPVTNPFVTPLLQNAGSVFYRLILTNN